ncbi:MAG: ABC-F family ATP-binding cassette domain-containing protein [Anaerolineaceae bacterium]|nr:ABC-F family ATP-binding cassette domain-containing protein [Anaerolineaceae bacterium]
MLQINRINKVFGDRHVLVDVTFALNDGEHAALIGSNGSGKTTLFEIISGKLEADSGTVVKSANDLIGYLPQNPLETTAQTIAELMLVALNQINPFPTSQLLPREKAEALRVLANLGLGYLELQTPLDILSGGERTRVQLASLLLQRPEILLLDEPTNHLDIPALEWLENFINNYPGSGLLISHDRLFLDHTITCVYELDEDREGVRKFPGDYSNYADLIAKEKQKAYEIWKDQESEIRRLKSDWINTAEQARYTEKRTKDSTTRRYAKKVAKKGLAKKKRLERHLEASERIQKPMDKWRIDINFAEPEHQSTQILSINDLGFGYTDELLFQNLDLYIQAGQRIALIGPNGSGKSTLLKVLMGQLAQNTGSYRWGKSVILGYMPQKQESLNPSLNSIESIQGVKSMSLSEVYHFLHYFLFDEDQVILPISALSFGQRARLLLARLVAQGANFLILDEPVNHLDIPSREQFEKALHAFSGGFLLVAHDRAFIARTCNTVWDIRNASIVEGVPDESWKYGSIEPQ